MSSILFQISLAWNRTVWVAPLTLNPQANSFQRVAHTEAVAPERERPGGRERATSGTRKRVELTPKELTKMVCLHS